MKNKLIDLTTDKEVAHMMEIYVDDRVGNKDEISLVTLDPIIKMCHKKTN